MPAVDEHQCILLLSGRCNAGWYHVDIFTELPVFSELKVEAATDPLLVDFAATYQVERAENWNYERPSIKRHNSLDKLTNPDDLLSDPRYHLALLW